MSLERLAYIRIKKRETKKTGIEQPDILTVLNETNGLEQVPRTKNPRRYTFDGTPLEIEVYRVTGEHEYMMVVSSPVNRLDYLSKLSKRIKSHASKPELNAHVVIEPIGTL